MIIIRGYYYHLFIYLFIYLLPLYLNSNSFSDHIQCETGIAPNFISGDVIVTTEYGGTGTSSVQYTYNPSMFCEKPFL